jgi:transcriptional regulator with XRE-family HTH domain
MAEQIRDTELLWKIAIKLKKLREAKGVSQRDVLDETNISVSRIETADADVRMSTMHALCKYFGITLSEFFADV